MNLRSGHDGHDEWIEWAGERDGSSDQNSHNKPHSDSTLVPPRLHAHAMDMALQSRHALKW